MRRNHDRVKSQVWAPDDGTRDDGILGSNHFVYDDDFFFIIVCIPPSIGHWISEPIIFNTSDCILD